MGVRRFVVSRIAFTRVFLGGLPWIAQAVDLYVVFFADPECSDKACDFQSALIEAATNGQADTLTLPSGALVTDVSSEVAPAWYRDGDRVITVLDARTCVLQRTCPRCVCGGPLGSWVGEHEENGICNRLLDIQGNGGKP